MPLLSLGETYTHRVDVDQETNTQLTSFCGELDSEIEKVSKAKGISPIALRFFRPLHFTAIVTDSIVFVVLSVRGLGSTPQWIVIDHASKPMDLQTACNHIAWELGFPETFGFQFPRGILEFEGNIRREAIAKVAEKCVELETERIEMEGRGVIMNPMFHGRGFLLNEKSVFVLMPFGDPFDTIYRNHIKPLVETVCELKCRRADDIYSTQAIMEDIWRYTNEARFLISDITGRNANVFYETGVAHTIGKDVILITQSIDDVPFDLKHLRHIVYQYTPEGIDDFKLNLRNTIINTLNLTD